MMTFEGKMGGCMYLMILFNMRGFMFCSVRYNIIPGQSELLLINTLMYADWEKSGACICVCVFL